MRAAAALVCAGLLLVCASCRVDAPPAPTAVPAPPDERRIDCDLIFPAPARDTLAP